MKKDNIRPTAAVATAIKWKKGRLTITIRKKSLIYFLWLWLATSTLAADVQIYTMLDVFLHQRLQPVRPVSSCFHAFSVS